MNSLVWALGIVDLVLILAAVVLVTGATFLTWRYEAEVQMRAARRRLGKKRRA